MLREIFVMAIMATGAFLMLLAGIGILRMPDLFLRMSSTAKAGTLGAGLILFGAALYFDNFSIYSRAIATIIFLLLTAPVAAHMIGRAAYFVGVPLWSGTVQDDLHGHYRAATHSLEVNSVPEEEGISQPESTDGEP